MDWNWTQKISNLRASRVPFAICTICEVKGSSPREVGAKMIVTGDSQGEGTGHSAGQGTGHSIVNGTSHGTIGGGRLEWMAIQDAREALKSQQSRKVTYPLAASVGQCCGGTVEVFIEIVRKAPQLFIFGAGHVGRAVCQTMDGTGFQIHLIDDRANQFDFDLPQSVIAHHCEWDEFVRGAEWDEKLSHAIVMTHEHRLDEAIIADIIRRPARYIGLIGSRAKWSRFQSRFRSRAVDEASISRVHCPIGIGDLGKSPKAVAISLAAELLVLDTDESISKITADAAFRDHNMRGLGDSECNLNDDLLSNCAATENEAPELTKPETTR